MTKENNIITTMNMMTNKEKARELADICTDCTNIGFCDNCMAYERYHAAMDMAEWKDKTLIDKACEWLSHRIFNCGEGDFIDDFRKAMEDKQ